MPGDEDNPLVLLGGGMVGVQIALRLMAVSAAFAGPDPAAWMRLMREKALRSVASAEALYGDEEYASLMEPAHKLLERVFDPEGLDAPPSHSNGATLP